MSLQDDLLSEVRLSEMFYDHLKAAHIVAELSMLDDGLMTDRSAWN